MQKMSLRSRCLVILKSALVVYVNDTNHGNRIKIKNAGVAFVKGANERN